MSKAYLTSITKKFPSNEYERTAWATVCGSQTIEPYSKVCLKNSKGLDIVWFKLSWDAFDEFEGLESSLFIVKNNTLQIIVQLID